MLYFVFMGVVRFSMQTVVISSNRINKLIVVTVKRGDLFEVRTELLNGIEMRFDFKGLTINGFFFTCIL
jgi:hypothetical protein